MSEYQREQRQYMNEAWQPGPWQARPLSSPAEDYLAYSTLHRCRELLPADLDGASLLIVNCGSGVDTQFFISEGARHVFTTDIAERALHVTSEHCPETTPVLAATEALPFSDGAFDFVGVRSGLHHLERPYEGLREMARVARKGFFFVEVHQTPFVPLLARLGLVEIVEEAGNTVLRFNRAAVRKELDSLGIDQYSIVTGWFMQIPALIRASRYFPGRISASLLRLWVRSFNAIAGAWGNAIIVVAYK